MPEKEGEEQGKSCKRAMMAAIDTMLEECSGEKGFSKPITKEVTVHLTPEEVKQLESEVGHSPGNPPENEEEKEKLIEACSHGKLAKHWAESIVGEEAPEEVKERTARKFCKGFYE